MNNFKFRVFAALLMAMSLVFVSCEDQDLGDNDSLVGDPSDSVIVEPVDTVIIEPIDTVIIDPVDTLIVEPVDTVIVEGIWVPTSYEIMDIDSFLVDRNGMSADEVSNLTTDEKSHLTDSITSEFDADLASDDIEYDGLNLGADGAVYWSEGECDSETGEYEYSGWEAEADSDFMWEEETDKVVLKYLDSSTSEEWQIAAELYKSGSELYANMDNDNGFTVYKIFYTKK